MLWQKRMLLSYLYHALAVCIRRAIEAIDCFCFSTITRWLSYRSPTSILFSLSPLRAIIHLLLQSIHLHKNKSDSHTTAITYLDFSSLLTSVRVCTAAVFRLWTIYEDVLFPFASRERERKSDKRRMDSISWMSRTKKRLPACSLFIEEREKETNGRRKDFDVLGKTDEIDT